MLKNSPGHLKEIFQPVFFPRNTAKRISSPFPRAGGLEKEFPARFFSRGHRTKNFQPAFFRRDTGKRISRALGNAGTREKDRETSLFRVGRASVALPLISALPCSRHSADATVSRCAGSKPSTLDTLDAPFADPDDEALRNKVNELILALRRNP